MNLQTETNNTIGYAVPASSTGTSTWPSTTTSWNYCPHCGRSLQYGWSYCPGCGAQVDYVKTPTPVPYIGDPLLPYQITWTDPFVGFEPPKTATSTGFWGSGYFTHNAAKTALDEAQRPDLPPNARR